jgi:hypothetical protein
MTRQKNLKRRVRSRMEKTGERYAAARRQLLAGQPKPSPDPADQQPIAGQRISDEALAARTGRGWQEWFAVLDGRQATRLSHGEIATWLSEAHDVPGWWAQTITVGYEQARGMREPGQASDVVETAAGLQIFVVCGREMAGAGIPTTQQVENELRNQQLNLAARRWLRDIRSNATVEVR